MNSRTALAVAAAMLAAPMVFAQANPRGEAKVKLAGKDVSVEYGRPSLKGRDMLGQASVGMTWRLGADGATTLKTAADLSFGGKEVAAGEYVLKAKKVAATQWHLLVTTDDTTVAEVPLAASELSESVEMFTIDLSGNDSAGRFELKWGETALGADFSAQ